MYAKVILLYDYTNRDSECLATAWIPFIYYLFNLTMFNTSHKLGSIFLLVILQTRQWMSELCEAQSHSQPLVWHKKNHHIFFTANYTQKTVIQYSVKKYNVCDVRHSVAKIYRFHLVSHRWVCIVCALYTTWLNTPDYFCWKTMRKPEAKIIQNWWIVWQLYTKPQSGGHKKKLAPIIR